MTNRLNQGPLYAVSSCCCVLPIPLAAALCWLLLLLLHPPVAPVAAAAAAVGWCCWWCYCKAFFYAGTSTVKHTLQNDKGQQKNDNARTSIVKLKGVFWRTTLVFAYCPNSTICLITRKLQVTPFWGAAGASPCLIESIVYRWLQSWAVAGSHQRAGETHRFGMTTDHCRELTLVDVQEGLLRIFVFGSSRLNSSQEHWKIWNLFWERFKSVLDSRLF